MEERYSIVFISTSDNKVQFILKNNDNAALSGGMNTYSGIIWHKGNNGTEVYWSIVGKNNSSFVASASWDGAKATFGKMFRYKPEDGAEMALPNEVLITKESDKEYLYVVLNGNSKVIKTGSFNWRYNMGS